MTAGMNMLSRKKRSLLAAAVTVMLAVLIIAATPGPARGADLEQDFYDEIAGHYRASSAARASTVDEQANEQARQEELASRLAREAAQALVDNNRAEGYEMCPAQVADYEVSYREYVLNNPNIMADLRRELEGLADAGQGPGSDGVLNNPKESLKETFGSAFPGEPTVGIDPSTGGTVRSGDGDNSEPDKNKPSWWCVFRERIKPEGNVINCCECAWDNDPDHPYHNAPGQDEDRPGVPREWYEENCAFDCGMPDHKPHSEPKNENEGVSVGNFLSWLRSVIDYLASPGEARADEPTPDETSGNSSGVGTTGDNSSSGESSGSGATGGGSASGDGDGDGDGDEDGDEDGDGDGDRDGEGDSSETGGNGDGESSEGEEDGDSKDTDCSPYDPQGEFVTGGGEGVETRSVEDIISDQGFHEQEDEASAWVPRPEYDPVQKVIDDNEKLGNIRENGPAVELQPRETGLTDPPKEVNQNTGRTGAPNLSGSASAAGRALASESGFNTAARSAGPDKVKGGGINTAGPTTGFDSAKPAPAQDSGAGTTGTAAHQPAPSAERPALNSGGSASAVTAPAGDLRRNLSVSEGGFKAQ